MKQNDKIVYVNREPQIRLLREALKHIRTVGGIFQTIFEFTGIPTIGKTVLVGLLCGVCEDEDVPYAHVDFDPERNDHAWDYLDSPASLLMDMALQLHIANQPAIHDAAQNCDKLVTASEEKRREALQALARVFRQEVNALLQKGPLAFFFDTTDKAHPAVLAFLEEEVVSLLTQKGRCLFVFAGRAALHWRRFEVRRRVYTERLEAFDPESVEDQLKHSMWSDLAGLTSQVYHLTGGLPLGNFVVSRRLDKWAAEGRALDVQAFPGYEPDLMDALIKEVMNKYIFKDVSRDLVEACYVLALVRQFDLILLRRLLSEFVREFQDYPRNAYGGLLSVLNATYLITWDDTRKGYSVDGTLRRILGRHTRLQNPGRFIDVNRAALEVYQDWIARVAEYRSIYVVEALYHEACVALVEREGDFSGLQESLDRYLGYYQDDDPDILDSMIDRLEKELESDLARDRLGGLGEILPEAVIQDLQKRIAARHEELKHRLATNERVGQT